MLVLGFLQVERVTIYLRKGLAFYMIPLGPQCCNNTVPPSNAGDNMTYRGVQNSQESCMILMNVMIRFMSSEVSLASC